MKDESQWSKIGYNIGAAFAMVVICIAGSALILMMIVSLSKLFSTIA